MYPLRLLLLLLVVCYCIALECYTGIKYIKGRSMGTSTKKCERPSDFCYNVSLDLTQFNEIKMAGCSTTRCMISPNKCIRQNLLGHEIIFCCCNTGDLCNSKLTTQLHQTPIHLRLLKLVKPGCLGKPNHNDYIGKLHESETKNNWQKEEKKMRRMTPELLAGCCSNLTTYEKLKERAKDIFKSLVNIKW